MIVNSSRERDANVNRYNVKATNSFGNDGTVSKIITLKIH